MDENNMNLPEENTTDAATENATDTATTNTTDSITENVTDTTSESTITSAFEMPSDNKTSAATTVYSAPEPTPESELKGEPESTTANQPDNETIGTTNGQPDNEPSTAIINTPDPVYHSSTDTVYASGTVEETSTSTGFAIASLVFGILSILTSCCCGLGGLCAILGIIFGCIQKKNEDDKKPGMAIAGIITSIIGILLCLSGLIFSTAFIDFLGTIPD